MKRCPHTIDMFLDVGLEFPPPQAPPPPPPEPTRADRFDLFHRENPHVFKELLKLARARLARGEHVISVKGLFEEIRGAIRTNGKGTFRLDNYFTAPYGRLLIAAAPEFDGPIRTRTAAAKRPRRARGAA